MGPSPIQGLSTVTTAIASGRHKDQLGTACPFPSHLRDVADETEGWGRAGVPPQQTAVLGRLEATDPAPGSL